MAMVQCDGCGAILDPKGFKKRHRTEGEFEIDYFRCGKCGKEYIGFISDGNLQRRVAAIAGQRAKIRLMIQKKMTRKSIRKEERKLDRMRAAALRREQELKRQYEEGILYGETGPESTDRDHPGGVQAGNGGPENPEDCGEPSETVSGHDSEPDRGENRLEQNAGNL